VYTDTNQQIKEYMPRKSVAAQSSPSVVQTIAANPGLVLLSSYIVLFIVNAVVLYLANLLSPTDVVLGTHALSPLWAILHSMGTLALLNTFAMPFAQEIERRQGRELTPKEWMIGYFVINAVGIWLIARFSQQFGLGISGWYVVVVLAAVMDIVQGGAMMQLGKILKPE
jgi:uncharacterized membrane protein YvlD (DUF360 family)